MPIFEYKCNNCGAMFEKLIRNSKSSTDCPKCQSGDTEKQLSSFAVSGCSSKPSGGGCSCGSCSGGHCSTCH